MKSKGGQQYEVQSQQDHVESMESLPQDKEYQLCRTKERNESMISVMDVLVIFLSGFISAKVCDYVHELEREENEA